jgi:hypothetical protein
MRFPAALLLGVLALAACGGSGGPSVDRTVAERLASRAASVAAAADACTASDRAQALQRQAIGAINAGDIPAEYAELLQARVGEIATELRVRCLPSLPPRSTAPPEPATSAPAHPHEQPRHGKGHGGHGHGRGHGHGQGHGHGHGKHDD